MKPIRVSPDNQHILKCYSELPHRILSMSGIPNLSEFVLHDLCHEHCLNLSKAAYFVDNLDFDTFKGVAGFDKSNEFGEFSSSWANPNNFTNHMQGCSFNKQVRSVELPSIHLSDKKRHIIFEDLADQLSISNPGFYSWNIKYDNKGVLIFEKDYVDECRLDEDLLKSLCFLGFCPIF